MHSPSSLRRIDQCLAFTGRALVAGAMILLALMTFLIVLQVVSRNLFNMGLPWADELARFTGIASVFFAVPWLQHQGRHIAVDLLATRIRGRIGQAIGMLNEAVVLGFCLLFLYSLWGFLERAYRFATPALGMPNWIFYAPVVAGMALCTLVTGLRLILLVRTGTPVIAESRPPAKGTPS